MVPGKHVTPQLEEGRSAGHDKGACMAGEYSRRTNGFLLY